MPVSLWPSLVKATTLGVVRAPSAFSITRGERPSMIATHELVVPATPQKSRYGCVVWKQQRMDSRTTPDA
jgi:hypothetical protein